MFTPNLRGILCLLLFSTLCTVASGQNSNVSIGTETLKDKALLWLKAQGNQGLLLPVVSDRNNFTGLNNSDEKGMLIYDASDNKVYYWNGSSWIAASGGTASNQTLTINGNTFNLTGAPASSINLSSTAPQAGQALVWNGSAWQSIALGGDVTGAQTATVVSGLKGKSLPSTLPSSTNALVYDGANWVFQPITSSGEANTGTNVGTGGIGVFKQKNGVTLEFLKLNAGSNKVSVTSDIANNEIDIDILSANLSLTAAQITGLGALATLSAIGSAQITDESITSADILNATITGPDIAANTITPDKLAQAAAGTGQVLKWNGSAWTPQDDNTGGSAIPVLTDGQLLIGNGSVNSGAGVLGDIALSGATMTIKNGAVTTAKINAAAVDNTRLADGAVTSAKIVDGSVTTLKIADSGVTTAKINAGAVDNSKLADNAVNAIKVLDGSITGTDIAATTITGNNLAAGTITGDKINQNGAANGQVLKWNGSTWTAQNDNTGTTTPILTAGQILIGNGTTNSGSLLGGDAALSGSTLTIQPNAITTGKINAAAVDNTKLADGAVTTLKIGDLAVTSVKLADNAVTTTKINAAAVDNTKLADNAVTTTKLADNAVTTLKINAGAVDNTRLADNAVTTIKITDANVTSAKLADNAVTTLKIADNAITNVKMADNAIGSTEIINASVTGADIAATTITGSNIAGTTITSDKLAQSSAAAGQVLKWNGTNWAASNDLTGSAFVTANEIPRGDGSTLVSSNIYSDGTNVGIGTSTPRGSAVLELQGANLVLSGGVGGPDDPVDIDFKTLGDVFKAKIWTDPNSNTLWFSTSTTPTTGKYLTIDPTGNIGIKNTAPSRALDVTGAGRVSGNFEAAGGSATGNSSVAIGPSAVATADNAFAYGSNVGAANQGSVILGDFAGGSLATTAANRMVMRFSGGYRLYSSAANNTGVLMNTGDNNWSSVSDSTKKENFRAVDGELALQKISTFRLGSWNYKGQDRTKYRHYGPMAQEFHAAFGNDGIGTIGNDTTINISDIDGVTMIAIKALEKRTSELKEAMQKIDENLKTIQELNSENAALKTEMKQISSAVDELKKKFEELERTQYANSGSSKK